MAILFHDFDDITIRWGTDSKKYGLYPKDVIPMWIADSDFKSPQAVIDALAQRLQHGIFGYPSESQRLKKAVSLWEGKRHAFEVTPDWVTFIPGVVGGLVCAIRAFSRPGDKVLIQTPCYPPFAASIENNGRRVLCNPLLLKEERYEIDFGHFERLCQDSQTRLFILCNPQNPTGRVFSEFELREMARICMENDILILSDEIHCDIVYPPQQHIPMASLSPKIADYCVTFISASKTFNLPGFRTAVTIASNSILRSRIHDVLTANKATGQNIMGTLASCVAFESGTDYADQLVRYLKKNLDLAKVKLKKTKLRLVNPEGTYLLWLDCRKVTEDPDKLMEFFVRKAKVGVQNGTDFGEEGRGFVRINIACPHSILDDALRRIQDCFEDGISQATVA